MATSLDFNKLVSELKKDSELTQGKAAAKLGLAIGQVPMIQFCRAQVAAGVYSEIKPKTGVQVKIARDRDNNRWELIAARFGPDTGVAAIKTMYEEAGGDPTAYVGRGRDFSGNGSTKQAGGKTGKTTPAKAGKPAASKPAGNKPSGGKPAGGRGKTAAAAPAVTRRTTKSAGGRNPS